jgi:hypothetical protein
MEVFSRNSFYRGEARSIKYYECVSVCALAIRHANLIFSAPSYSVIYGQFVSTLFFRIILSTARFSEKKVTEHKIYFYYLYNVCLKHVSF